MTDEKAAYSKNHLEDEVPPRVYVGIPSRGPVHIAWHMNMIDLSWPVNESRKTRVAPGIEVANARNNLVLDAQGVGSKYMFFIDDDVVVPRDAPQHMIYQMETHPEWDMLTGIYVTKTVPPEPLVFGGKPGTSGAFWDWVVGETFPVWGAGMGCALIRMTAFDKFPDPWFKFSKSVNDDGGTNEEGEDMYFCRKLREAGGTIMADGSVICGHIDVKNGKMYRLWADTPPVRNARQEIRDNTGGLISKEPVMLLQAKDPAKFPANPDGPRPSKPPPPPPKKAKRKRK